MTQIITAKIGKLKTVQRIKYPNLTLHQQAIVLEVKNVTTIKQLVQKHSEE